MDDERAARGGEEGAGQSRESLKAERQRQKPRVMNRRQCQQSSAGRSCMNEKGAPPPPPSESPFSHEHTSAAAAARRVPCPSSVLCRPRQALKKDSDGRDRTDTHRPPVLLSLSSSSSSRRRLDWLQSQEMKCNFDLEAAVSTKRIRVADPRRRQRPFF